MNQEFYNVKEAASIMQMHPESVRRLSRDGTIKFGRAGKNYRYTIAQIRAYVELNGSSALQRKISAVLEK